MGICISSHSTSVVTGKLILPNGNLQEFSVPIKVSDVLRQHPSTFNCNSDEMDFDAIISPIKEDDDLQPGHLYFALSSSRLKRPLQPEEMAALALMASAALAKCGKNVCFTSSFYGVKGCSREVVDVYTIGLSRRSCGGVGGGGGGDGGGGGGGKRGDFKAMLRVIPE